MDDFERELKEDFLAESSQLLEDTEQSFLELENNPDDPGILDEIFRLAHNLKGTSRAVGFGEVAEFTHEMENLILKLKEGIIPVTEVVVNVLLACNDHITEMIKGLEEDMDKSFDSTEIIAQIKSVLESGGVATSGSAPVPEPAAGPVPDMMEGVPSADGGGWEDEGPAANAPPIDEDLLREAMALGGGDAPSFHEGSVPVPEPKPERTSNVAEVAQPAPVKPAPAPKPVAKEAAPAKKADKGKGKKKEEDIRVSLSRVEKLNNFVGELVILQTVLAQRKETLAQDPLMAKTINQLGKLSTEIQEISMSLRMIPIKATFQKMQRIVRDTSKALNKKVNLMLEGEDTEIDKTVLEKLGDPLVHIVRNAVDHGLESTEKRVEVGKTEEGNVILKAVHEGNNLVIEVRDDGGGINHEIIKKKGIEKGLIPSDTKMSPEEIIQLIFAPGFSTKEQLTEISGRGVGMDVVMTNIKKLSGDIHVKTNIGSGSIFKVTLPLTLAIIEGMVIKIANEKYIIPLTQIRESLKPSEEIIHSVTGVGDCLNLRGEVMPLFKVANTLKRPNEDKKASEQIAIIVNSNDFDFGVLVDDILHQQQVVIKKLGREIKDQKGFMGSSILGDGMPVFILDLNELYAGPMKKHNSSLKKRSDRMVA